MKFFFVEYNWNRRRYHYWWICGTQNITSETDDYETEGDITNHWFVKGCRSWHSMNCQKKFSNFRPFLAISPNAGSIILTREAQQRRSQNSSPNRFHSSDMRAFLGVHAQCCQHMLFFISRIERRKENQRQGDNDRVIESVFAQWCNKEEDQSAWRDLCNNRCTMCNNCCNNQCTTIKETATCTAQSVTTIVTINVQKSMWPMCSWRL